MYNIDINTKVHDFFDSVIEILELSKLYTFDINELSRIDSNIKAVKNMKMPSYFVKTPYILLGLNLTDTGFNKFNTKKPLFKIFDETVVKMYIHYVKKTDNSLPELLSALQEWNETKPKNTFKDMVRKIIPKKFFDSKQLVH